MNTEQLLIGYADASKRCNLAQRVPRSKKEAGRTGELSALMMVAHDLRGPLSNLGLLIEGIVASSARGLNERTETGARKAEKIVDQLHAVFSSILSRTRRGGDPLSFDAAPVQLPDVLEAVVELNEPAARNRDVRVHCHCVEPLEVWGDEHLLHEAIDNLINNAIKHTRPGGLVVCETVAHDNEALVRITDEGPGLTENDLARAFKPFTRLSAMTNELPNSVGLGLWIARLIAQRHGGQIDVCNRASNTGAIFTLHLPLN